MTDYKQILIRDAGLSTMATNCLANGGGFYRMGEVEQVSVYDLLRIPNLGRKTMREIEDWFAEHGALAGERRAEAVHQLRSMRERAQTLRAQADQTDANIAHLLKRLGGAEQIAPFQTKSETGQ